MMKNIPKEQQQKPLFEILLEGMEHDIPSDEWEKLPVDGAENHDHYLYGSRKKNDEEQKQAA